MSTTGPLVSVGVPTFNRPEGLRRTLGCMLRQTHGNIEIIVSDNASTDPGVRSVLDEHSGDPRVRVFVQDRNRGSFHNFNWLLKESRGDFFMWAADDDDWSETFIADCLERLVKEGPEVVAVCTEARYMADGRKLDLFPEGRAFYEFASGDPLERMKHVLRHGYGNLFYSLFRRDALFHGGESVFDRLRLKSLNEMPIFLFVMRKGNWRVIPTVGIYKTTTEETYLHARWEKMGGRLPRVGLAEHIGFIVRIVLRYHLLTLTDVFGSLGRLPIGFADGVRLRWTSGVLLSRHFLAYVLRRKRPAC